MTAESVADFIFFVVAGITAIISVVLFFHWRKYSLGGAVVAIIELIYLAVAVTLLGAAFFAIN